MEASLVVYVVFDVYLGLAVERGVFYALFFGDDPGVVFAWGDFVSGVAEAEGAKFDVKGYVIYDTFQRCLIVEISYPRKGSNADSIASDVFDKCALICVIPSFCGLPKCG